MYLRKSYSVLEESGLTTVRTLGPLMRRDTELSDASISECEAAQVRIRAGNLYEQRVTAFWEALEMLAKSLEIRPGNALRVYLSVEKWRFWQQFGSESGFFGEMLVKLARSGYSVRLPAVGVPLPLMP